MPRVIACMALVCKRLLNYVSNGLEHEGQARLPSLKIYELYSSRPRCLPSCTANLPVPQRPVAIPVFMQQVGPGRRMMDLCPGIQAGSARHQRSPARHLLLFAEREPFWFLPHPMGK